MAIPGRSLEERAGDHQRSPKRQRVNFLDEDSDGEQIWFRRSPLPNRQRVNFFDDDEEEEEEEEIVSGSSPMRQRATLFDEDEYVEEEEEEEISFGRNRSPMRQQVNFSPRWRLFYSDDDEEEEEIVVGTRTATVGSDSIYERRSERSSSSLSPQSVKLQSSDLLDCPTCCEPLKSPIYQCINGHIACSSCCTKLMKKCSFCKSRIGDIRCRAMEKIIEATIVPCANAIYGCKETTTYGNQPSHHEKNLCVFTRCSCPLPNCDYVGSYENLKLHVFATHSNHGNLIPFAFNIASVFVMNLVNKKRVVLHGEKGDLFVVQAFKGSHGVYVTVRCIAPPGVSNFSCSLAKLDQFSTLKLGFVVKNIQKLAVREEVEEDDIFMLIPPNMSSSEQWKMKICIGHRFDYIHI